MQDFRKLAVWGKAHVLTLQTYRNTQHLPRGYAGLQSQIRRAVGSIPTNIAEGCGRDGNRQLARYLQMALASASELDYHLLLAADLGLLERSAYVDLAGRTKEVKRMLTVLVRRVRARLDAPPQPIRGEEPPSPSTEH